LAGGSVSIVATVLSADTHEPLANIQETLIDEKGNKIKTTRTNEEGVFRFENLEANQSYKVLIEEVIKPTVNNQSKIIVVDIKVKGSSESVTETHFENIYFDFSLSTIRPEAEKVLEELIEYYNDNLQIQIEINANTDAIGTSDYNVKLSQRRGNVAYQYLVDHGVDRSSIVINAKGESDEFVSNSSIIGRQLNRRVEFIIIGGGQYNAKAMTYIVGTSTSLQKVARQFNMTIDELKDMNNMDTEEVYAYRPLRVRNIGDDDLVSPVTFADVSKKNKKHYKNQHKRFGTYQKDFDKLNVTYSNYESVKEQLELKNEQDYYVALFQNTLWRISKLYGMSVDELKVLNNLSSSRIYINQPIIVIISNKLPPEGYYRVEKGDSLESMAQEFGVSVEELTTVNSLSGYSLRYGMLVKVKL
jgi:outer membrane protein OmpA-like peptidoglycan-associated protein/LysM repeat protein